VSTKTTLKTL